MRHDYAVVVKRSKAERAIRARISGKLRDVGLRDAAVGRAGELGVLGWVRLAEDDVLVHAEGGRDDVEALIARLREGLLSFADRPGGGPAVKAVHQARAALGDGPQTDRFPDLLVEWSPAPATAVDAVVSPVHGVVRRPGGPGGATGRSANHLPGEGWVLAIPGAGATAGDIDSWRHADIAPTVAALLGVDLPGADGVARLQPA